MDDLLLQDEDKWKGPWRLEGRQQRQDESNRENSTILPDDDNILDVPDLPLTVQWCTMLLLKDEDGK